MNISIVTPSYNQGRFIEKTIKSVLSQDIQDMEYWVVDGGSTDGTLRILQQYDDRLNWVSEKDAGQTDAVNKGIRFSDGDIIGWLNSDDIYYPGALAAVRNYFVQHPEVQILYGDADHIDETDGLIEPYPTEEWNYDRLLETCFICQPAVFFRRSLVEQVGELSTILQYCMDYEYWLRIGKITAMAHLPIRLAGSRLYPETKTLGSRQKVHEEILSMVCNVSGRFSLRWASNLGHVIAEERGLRRDSFWQEFQFCLQVCSTIMKEKTKRGFAPDKQDLKLMKEWMLHLVRRWRQEAKNEDRV